MKDIKQLHPTLQIKIAQFLEECEKQGLKPAIGEGLRTVSEQNALYAQGRTKPGSIVTNAPGDSYSSMHQWGVAFDFYRNDGTGAYNESGSFFEKAGQIGQSVGLEWGGTWKSIMDKPHLQLPDWGSTPSKLKVQYGKPETFIKTWQQAPGWIQDGTGWWYRHSDGSYTKNDWEKIDGNWYWFNGAGYAITDDWYLYKDKWYYLGEDGKMLTGLQIIKGKIYYFNEKGEMATSAITLVPDDKGVLNP